jgi:hypothetical protein
MSTIKANAYLDAAGGNTATINGITPALSSLAQAQAGTDNTTQMTPLRTSNAITALTTSTVVGAATAGLAVGAVGSYAMLQSAATRATGASVAGSSLTYFGLNTGGVSSSGSPSGTWMLMGYLGGGTNQGSVWLRTA